MIAKIDHNIQLIVSIYPAGQMDYGTARAYVEEYMHEQWPDGGWKWIDADTSEVGPEHDCRWWFLYQKCDPELPGAAMEAGSAILQGGTDLDV